MLPLSCSKLYFPPDFSAKISVSVVWVAKALEKLTPKQQKNMIGELLYPLIQKIQPWFAPKITGMILEMEQDELLHLLQSPEALNETVKKAIEILGDWIPQQLKKLSPQQQKQMIGELLYPLVEKLEPWFAPKITGMILELDQDKLFHLLESPEALKETVKEAIDVLGDWIPQQLQLLEQEAYKLQAAFSCAKL